MTERVFSGLVDLNTGRLSLDQREAWRDTLRSLKGQRVQVKLEKAHANRTLAQNARYWVMCEAVAELLSAGRAVPLNKDQAHHVLASAFLGQEETPLGPTPMSTRALTVEQFTLYMDKIESHFASVGTPLPTTGPA